METDTECHIIKLPSEVVTTILQHTEIEDIVAFGATCKYYNAMIKECEILWKIKFKNLHLEEIICFFVKTRTDESQKMVYSKQISFLNVRMKIWLVLREDFLKRVVYIKIFVNEITEELFQSLKKDIAGENWFDLIKEFYTIRQKVYTEILAMSPKHFWQENSLTLHDVRRFFTIALISKKHYYYTIYLLQDLVSNGVKKTAMWEARPPYTLTEMHYAKVVLSHIVHSFLSVKWAQRYNSDEMLPYTVLTFFLQWMNVVKLYNQDEVNEAINSLVRDVEVLMLHDTSYTSEPGKEVKRQVTEKTLSEQDVLSAISEVLYRQKKIVLTPTMDLETLNIIEVLKKKTGHLIAVACIYHAIADKCGVVCTVTAFTDHFLLEWKYKENGQEEKVRKINLENGELQLKRHCPFYNENWNSDYSYCPNSFLRYLVTTFTDTVEVGHLGYNNWYRQNAFLLFELLNPESAQNSSYYNYFRYLTHDMPMNSLSPIGVKDIQKDPLQILLELTYLNTPANPSGPCRSIIVKKRNSHVRYAVGMICCHVKYLYSCIIVDWDPMCEPSWMQHPDIATLQFGHMQPFYKVIAADESSRYIPQEKLLFVTNPQRMIYLEDFIAREFTHFNGFAYVPNKEKRLEYPEDLQISEMFLSRAENKFGICMTDPFALDGL